MDPKRPGGEMKSNDASKPTRSQLLPFGDQWQDLTTKPYFVPGIIASLVMALLFTFMGSGAVVNIDYFGLPVGLPMYIVTLALCITVGGMYAVYRMAGKPKAWWTMPAIAVITGLLVFGPVLGTLQSVFGVVGERASGDAFVVRFVKMFFMAGLPEETFKALPVLAGVFIGKKMLAGRLSPRHPARQFAVLEPLDGILIGAAAGLGFAFAETLGQYVPSTMVETYATISGLQELLAQLRHPITIKNEFLNDSSAWFAIVKEELQLLVQYLGRDRAVFEFQRLLVGQSGQGLQLMIPRLLHVVTGHAAYAGIMGYFIGLAALRPAAAVKTVLTGLAIVATLHGLWDSIHHNTFTMMALACVSFFALSVCIMKGRMLSPERSQLVASQLIDRFSPGSMVRPTTPVAAPARPTGPVPTPGGQMAPTPQPTGGSITWDDDSSLRVLELGSARIPAAVGTRLYERQCPGLRALRGDGVVAEVSAHPSEPSMLGLKNLSEQPWAVSMPDGQQRDLQPGRNIRLAVGMTVRLGDTTARVL